MRAQESTGNNGTASHVKQRGRRTAARGHVFLHTEEHQEQGSKTPEEITALCFRVLPLRNPFTENTEQLELAGFGIPICNHHFVWLLYGRLRACEKSTPIGA